jgi:hypothetical protein
MEVNMNETLTQLLTDLWWFIENVNEDTPDRTDRFFALRERVRGMSARTPMKRISSMTDNELLAELLEPRLTCMSVIARGPDAIYLRLPRELQRDCDGCDCSYCKAHPHLTPAWDTLAIPMKPSNKDFSWTVHMPNPAESIAYWNRKKGKA